MGRTVDELIAALPRTRRLKVEAKSRQLAREMIEHADSLGEIRKALSKTQVEIARELGVGQVAVAQLEKRSDLLLSTLQRYVRATGAELSLVVHTRDGNDIVLQGLGDLGVSAKLVAKPTRTTTTRLRRRSNARRHDGVPTTRSRDVPAPSRFTDAFGRHPAHHPVQQREERHSRPWTSVRPRYRHARPSREQRA